MGLTSAWLPMVNTPEGTADLSFMADRVRFTRRASEGMTKLSHGTLYRAAAVSLNIGWILGHILAEESQHLGQVAYIRGMIRGFDG